MAESTVETLPCEASFLGMPETAIGFEKARAVIWPIPYEGTTTYVQGTANGPAAILQASHQVEVYDDELDAEPCQAGIATLPPIRLKGLAHDRALAEIGAAAASLLRSGKFLVALGGEHSITIPLVHEACKQHPQLSVLQLDAHSDLRDSYEGSKLNHACVMARVNESCASISVGLRSGLAGEKARVRPDSRLIYARDMQKTDWQQDALEALSRDVYITVDLDFFEPAVMPAVGTPEPGGFHWYETLAFLRRVFQEKNVVACDVVELCPIPGLVYPDFFAAKLLYKLLGYKLTL